jgi:hypothetical protein
VTPTECKARIEAFSGGRDALRKFEDLAIELIGEVGLSPAKGALMVAKEAIHVARLAVLEAVERCQGIGAGRERGGWSV